MRIGRNDTKRDVINFYIILRKKARSIYICIYMYIYVYVSRIHNGNCEHDIYTLNSKIVYLTFHSSGTLALRSINDDARNETVKR